MANVSWQVSVTLVCSMVIYASVETSLASMVRLTMPNVPVCVLEIKPEIVELSGIAPSFLLVSTNN